MASAIGVFISVPFLPPTDAYRMRPYAASIVVFAALPAMGLAYLIRKLKKNREANERLIVPPNSILIYSFILTLTALIGPVSIKALAKPQPIQTTSCAAGLSPILVRFDEGTYINLKKQNDPFLDWMPNFHTGLFRENSHSLADSNMITWAENIDPPKTIFVTMDYLNPQRVLVVIPTTILPKAGALTQICGQWETAPKLVGYGIFYGEEIQ
jgi:hypothetical protein